MNPSDRDQDRIRKGFKNLEPPDVAPAEWEKVWSGIARRSALPLIAGGRSVVWKRWAFAAVFLIGLAVGFYIGRTRDVHRSPVQTVDERGIPVDARQPVPTLTGLEPESSPEGMDLFGLRNVKVERFDSGDSDGLQYQVSGYTPRGLRVVWNYPLSQVEGENILGGQL